MTGSHHDLLCGTRREHLQRAARAARRDADEAAGCLAEPSAFGNGDEVDDLIEAFRVVRRLAIDLRRIAESVLGPEEY